MHAARCELCYDEIFRRISRTRRSYQKATMKKELSNEPKLLLVV